MARHAASKIIIASDERIELVRAAAARNPEKFIQNKFRIPCDEDGTLVPFNFRFGQRQAFEIYKEELKSGKPIRVWFLKSRRIGFTSVFAADNLVDVWARDNRRVGIVAHNDDRARRILAMCKMFYKQLDPAYQFGLSKDATAGLKFAHHDSELVIGTCKFPDKIRGDGLHRAHLSEAAFYKKNFTLVMDEIATTIAPAAGTAIIIETTGKNRGSACHQHWQEAYNGENQYRAKFFPWWEDPECARPFDGDRHKMLIMEEMTRVEPRLAQRCKAFTLSPEQIHWIYWQFVYRGNLNYETFIHEFPFDPEDAWASEGASFFGDNEIHMMSLRKFEKPLMYNFSERPIAQIFEKFSELKEVQKVDDNAGLLHIKLWSMPQKDQQYVIGSDPSLGEAGSDFSSGHIINRRTREMMGCYHGRIRPDEHAYLLVSLATIFNNAMLAPEVNPGGGGNMVLDYINRLGYFNVYQFRHRDRVGGHQLTQALGWWTTHANRSTILLEMRKMFHDSANQRFNDPGMFKDEALFAEMRSFHVDPDSGRAEAMEDAYDDRIFSLAIAHQAASDDVMMTADDLYLTYAGDEHKTPAQKFIDQIEDMGKAREGDAVDMIDRFMNRDFDLNDGVVEWFD
jgi:hypothetical protein